MKMKWNVPNILSLFRLALVPVIATSYLMSDEQPALLYVFMIALAISGLSDVVDGYIARHFNQITDIGKVLDPVADKMTQLTVLICLTIRHVEILPLTVICLAKEGCQLIGGMLLLGKGIKMQSSKWFGKLSTVSFYTIVLVLVAPIELPGLIRWFLIAVLGILMLFAFISYTKIFKTVADTIEDGDDSTTEEKSKE